MATSPPADQALLDEAVALARMAGDFTLSYFRSSELIVEAKRDGTPVTEADRGAERLLRAELARRHPGDGIYGEEEGETAGHTGQRWIIDPVDGTQAFTRGVPLYVNLLAVEDEYGIAAGVINIPALAETVWAGRGLGCFCNGVRAHVSSQAELSASYVCSSGYDYWDEEPLLRLRRSGLRMRTWGDGYGYALVATGRVEAMVDPVAALYDLAPMPVIVGEAGGRFTDFTGRNDIAGGNGLATNGAIHEALLAVLTGD
jgi:histidinol phosphatase-like enzyme (inositol monophosphatase family)